jgi:hypothetical protein
MSLPTKLAITGLWVAVPMLPGFGLKRLVDLPMAWPDQWRTLGLRAPARA